MAGTIQFVSVISRESDARKAAHEVLSAAAARIGASGVDLALLFVSSSFTKDAPSIVREVHRVLKPRALTGCSGEGVIGEGEEIEADCALSLIAAQLPGCAVETRALSAAEIHDSTARPETLAESVPVSNSTRLLVVLADPFSTPIDRLLESFNRVHGGLPVVGGLASALRAPGGNVLFCGEEIRRDGAVVMALSGPVEIDVIVSQGCRPIGRPYRISDARDNVILGLDRSPPLDELRKLVEDLPSDERELLRNGIFLGRAIDPDKEVLGRGDFLIRGLIGVDPRSGSVTVGDVLETGQTVQFHLRDARTAEEDLELLLSPHSLFTPPRGAILFSCNGRGTRLYDHPNGDVSVVRRFFPGLSLAGFFCAGEIGPVGGRNFLHGHTATLALFRSLAGG
jgi:small ligand-binding sensory domain FIST